MDQDLTTGRQSVGRTEFADAAGNMHVLYCLLLHFFNISFHEHYLSAAVST